MTRAIQYWSAEWHVAERDEVRKMNKYAELLRRSAEEHEASFAESDLTRELRAAADEIEQAEPIATLNAQGPGPIEVLFTEATDFGTTLPHGTKLYPAPVAPADEWKAAIDHELVMIGATVDTFDSPREAITELLDWHVQVALDPAVSSEAADLEDGQLEAIVVAYQMGFEKGLIGATRKNPYGSSWSCDKAWDYGYDEGCLASGRMDDERL